MKHLTTILVISLFVFISGCGSNNSTSSGGGSGIELSKTETNTTAESGETIYVVYDDEGTVGEAVTLLVKFRKEGVAPGASTGTLHWGDQSAARVRDGMQATHAYDLPGTYRIALQPDGGEKVLVATIVIEAAPVEVGEESGPRRIYAGAMDVGGPRPFKIEARSQGNGNYLVNILNPFQDSIRSGILNLDGTPGVLATNPNCGFPIGRDFNASIISASEAGMVIRIDRAKKPDLDFNLSRREKGHGISLSDCT